MAEVKSEKKVKRQWQRVSANHLFNFLKDAGITRQELANHLGVAPGTVGSWLNENDAPKISLVAIEALKRRRQGSSALDAERIAALEEEIKQLKDGQIERLSPKVVEAEAAQRPTGIVLSDYLDDIISKLVALRYGRFQ